MISKTIDISVTSVLQTTAGKMIFGKYDERACTPSVGELRPRTAPPAKRSAAAPSRSHSFRENHGRIVGRMKVAVILPAAGLGTRMGKGPAGEGGTSRKQFMLLEARRS